MASEDGEASSKLKAWRTAEHRKGTDTELIAITHPTKLYVLCGEHFEGSKACFRAGDFSVRVIRLSGNPVSMVTCMVGDHQWMLAKDSRALRVGDRSYVFALPGLLYGLALPTVGVLENECKVLEQIFASFCAYQDLVNNDGAISDDAKPEDGNWAGAYSKILNLATRARTKISPSSTTTTNSPEQFSSPSTLTSEKIQRAIRMSAAVKLASRALLSGALLPYDHMHLSVMAGTHHAYPTMWAIADVLEAIEARNKPFVKEGRAVMEGFWGFKEEGLRMLLDVVKAYGVATGRKRSRS